jgi:hypothetical protein
MKQVAKEAASCLANFSTLKMEAICSSETSVDFNELHGVIGYFVEFVVGSLISDDLYFRSICEDIYLWTSIYFVLSIQPWPSVRLKEQGTDKNSQRQ